MKNFKNPISNIFGKFSKLKKQRKIIIIALLLIAAAGSSFAIYAHNKNSKDSSQQQYLTATVTKGDIATTVTETGTIQPSKTSEIISTINGTVGTLYVSEGDTVTEGQILGTIITDDSDVGAETAALNYQEALDNYNDLLKDRESLKVYANATGAVTLAFDEIGTSIGNGEIFATIKNNKVLELKAPFAASSASNIKVGDKANVLVTGYYQTLSGTVTKVGSTSKAFSDYEGTLYRDVTIEITNPGALTTTDSAVATVVNGTGSYQAMDEVCFTQKTGSNIRVNADANLEKLYVSDGDVVKKGDLIAVFTSDSLEKEIASQKRTLEQKRLAYEDEASGSILEAPISGTVVSVDYVAGDTVSEGSSIITIANLDNLDVVMAVDELDINKIKVGQKASITSDNFEGQTFSATVRKISMVGTSSNDVTTFDVYLSLEGNAAFKPNMTVDATIAIESREDTLLLPVEAVQQDGDTYFVLMNSDGSKREIKTGLVSDTYIEITDGLEEGDVVKYAADLGSSDSEKSGGMMMMPGGGPGKGGGAPPNGGGNQRSGGGGQK